jgi:hypothetical protein
VADARRALEAARGIAEPATFERAREEVLIAEGSDWFCGMATITLGARPSLTTLPAPPAERVPATEQVRARRVVGQQHLGRMSARRHRTNGPGHADA